MSNRPMKGDFGCFKCGGGSMPQPDCLCWDCSQDQPEHPKNSWYDTWSDERREAFDDDPQGHDRWLA